MLSDNDVRAKARVGKGYRKLALQPAAVLLATLYVMPQEGEPGYVLGYSVLAGSFVLFVYLIAKSKRFAPAIKELEYRAKQKEL